MNASTLCTLLAQRIPPEQFQLWGPDVHWMKKEYNTPGNQAIVADVLKNYDKLAAPIIKQQEIDEYNAPIKAKILDIDMRRIRPLAENDNQYLKGLNEQIIALRKTLK
uniref:Uncharacterized protein n=1 Tax=viral metagenome TaxID=1070528 RepID=A0A6M3KT14_9ZZZZ